MDFSTRRSSKASISIPPTQIPLPRASLNKLPAQLRKPNLGGARRKPRGKNSRARRLAKGCEQQQPCAQVAGSKQRAGRNRRQATRREVPCQRKSKCKKLGRHQARFARALAQQDSRFKKTSAALQRMPSRLRKAAQKDRAISKLKKIRVPPAGLCRRPQLRVST